jgi:Histone methylation protein DOT1
MLSYLHALTITDTFLLHCHYTTHIHQGEFDLHFLSDLLDQYGAGPSTHFADLGSGAGRQASHVIELYCSNSVE